MGESNITVLLDPERRAEHQRRVLTLRGLGHVTQQRGEAYCPISLTLTPEMLKKTVLKPRQEQLMALLRERGLKPWDPYGAPLSPDRDTKSTPQVIYSFDAGKVGLAEYVAGHVLLGSNGQGAEFEMATAMGKKTLFLVDKGVRISRMMPPCAIVLGYDHFLDSRDRVGEVVDFLAGYDTGVGQVEGAQIPVLLGFARTGNSSPINLEAAVREGWPDLRFDFDGSVPITRMVVENSEVFYELCGG